MDKSKDSKNLKDQSIRPKEKVRESEKSKETDIAMQMTQILGALNKITERLDTMEGRIGSLEGRMGQEFGEVKKQCFDSYNKVIEDINTNFVKYAAENTAIKDNIDQLHVQTKKLIENDTQIFYKQLEQEKRINLIEEEARKSNLVLRGVTELKPDNIRQRVLDWLNSIGLGRELTMDDFAGVFRIGLRRVGGKKRNVLVKFASLNDKLRVMTLIRGKGDEVLQLEGNKIEVYQDISREERTWRYSLKPITKLLRNKGIKYNWRFPQSFKFFYNKKMHTIDSSIDPVYYLHKLGLIDKEEDVINVREELLKMGGFEQRAPTVGEGEGSGVTDGGDPKPRRRPRRKRHPTEKSPGDRKRSREGKGTSEESEMEDQPPLGSEEGLGSESECGEEATGEKE